MHSCLASDLIHCVDSEEECTLKLVRYAYKKTEDAPEVTTLLTAIIRRSKWYLGSGTESPFAQSRQPLCVLRSERETVLRALGRARCQVSRCLQRQSFPCVRDFFV